MIHYRCPKCKTVMTASDEEAGSQADCSHCGQKLHVPVPSTSIQTTPVSPDLPESVIAAEQMEIRPDDAPGRPRRRDDEEDADRERGRRVRRNEPSIQATDFLVPTNVSGWSLAACYFGLIGLCLPFIGLIFAIPALICGIVALLRRRKTVSYGSVTSDVRAILGLVFSSLSILIWGAFTIVMIVKSAR